jgi:hypothetical protein
MNINLGIDSVTGEIRNAGKNPRFTMWTSFLLFSTIVMGSSVGEVCRLLNVSEP